MDDLISRSAVKQEIESLQMTVTGLRAGKGVLRDFMNQYKESVLRIIDEQPTAYNVDKVIQEIEEFKDMDSREQHCVETKELDKCGDFDDCEQCMLEKTISFIKAGGVNG